MPSLASQISAAQNAFVVQVKRTGRVRAPNLSDAQLKAIGDQMVLSQKVRWSKGINASGQLAKKLSVKYAIIKQAVLHKTPIRDMQMTGATVRNFQLRKAADGRIRAENTTRLERSKATRANSFDQMIGFSVFDSKVVFDAAKKEFGAYLNTAWIPLDSTNRRPSQLNRVPPTP